MNKTYQEITDEFKDFMWDIEQPDWGWWSPTAQTLRATVDNVPTEVEEAIEAERKDDIADLERLLNVAYVFIGMNHKALSPWKKNLDEWLDQVEDTTGWSHFDECEKFKAKAKDKDKDKDKDEYTSTLDPHPKNIKVDVTSYIDKDLKLVNTLELPGVRKGDCIIKIDKHRKVTINGRRWDTYSNESWLSASFLVPHAWNIDDPEIELVDGVLIIKMKKADTSNQTDKIYNI